MTETSPAAEQLLAIEEIKQLKARYFRLMDTKRWDEWGSVFTIGGRMEVPEADLVLEGRQAIVDGVKAALADQVRHVHHGHMPEITLTGADTAEGIWAMFDFVEWPSKGDRAGLVGYGHYHERYERTDEGWQIAWVRLERLRVDPLG